MGKVQMMMGYCRRLPKKPVVIVAEVISRREKQTSYMFDDL